MKTFNEHQMRDPWAWCVSVILKHGVRSRVMADQVGAPRSTMRALYNATTSNPRYSLLMDIIDVCIRLENDEMKFLTAADPVKQVNPKPAKVASKQPDEEFVEDEQKFDFL